MAAKDITFEASVDKNVVTLGDSVQLSLTFGGATDAPAPQIQEPEGFSAKYLGPFIMTFTMNGVASSSIRHVYTLIPLKAGKFILGPFTAEYNGQRYATRTIEIEVTDSSAQQKQSQPKSSYSQANQASPGSIEEQLKDRIFIEFEVGQRDVFINEIIPVTMRFYINRIDMRNSEPPLIMGDGFVTTELVETDRYQKSLAGLIYQVYESKASAYALKSGTLILGPVKMKCNIVVRRQSSRRRGSVFDDLFGEDDIFGGVFGINELYPLDLKSQEVLINVKPLPSENRPADFTGAVGRFDMQVEADQLSVKAGDPITLKMTVHGEGNFAGAGPPVLENTRGLKVYEPQSKMEAGRKVFEQVIIPLSEDVKYIPEIKFSFFDPAAGAYQTVTRGPIAITVSKPDTAGQAQGPGLIEAPQGPAQAPLAALPEKEEALGKDIIYIKDNPGALIKTGAPLYQSRWIPLALVAWPLVFLALFFIERRNQRLKTDTRYARLRMAYKKARHSIRRAEGLLKAQRQDEFYRAVFGLLQEYIGDRLHIPSAGITAETAERYLADSAAPDDLAAGLKALFETIDAARFAPASIAKDKMPEVLRLAKDVIEGLERVKL